MTDTEELSLLSAMVQDKQNQIDTSEELLRKKLTGFNLCELASNATKRISELESSIKTFYEDSIDVMNDLPPDQSNQLAIVISKLEKLVNSFQ